MPASRQQTQTNRTAIASCSSAMKHGACVASTAMDAARHATSSPLGCSLAAACSSPGAPGLQQTHVNNEHGKKHTKKPRRTRPCITDDPLYKSDGSKNASSAGLFARCTTTKCWMFANSLFLCFFKRNVSKSIKNPLQQRKQQRGLPTPP